MSYENKKDYENLLNIIDQRNHCIMSQQMREFKKMKKESDIRVLFAIIHLQKGYDSCNMPAKFYVIGKKWWNEFINENNTLSDNSKKQCIITNLFY